MNAFSPTVDEIANDETAGRSTETVFDLLSHQRRRHAVAALLDSPLPMGMDELAEEVAVREHETARAGIPDDALRPIKISLYHVHIPKLVDAGRVGYDRSDDLVLVADAIDPIRALLASGTDGEAIQT